MKTITEQLQWLVKTSGLSNRAIALRTGVAESTIVNIAAGKAVSCNTAEAVAGVFGMRFALVDVVPELCEEVSGE